MTPERVHDSRRLSWFEATARQRVEALVDAGSFVEFLGPTERVMSPHLSVFELPTQFDDGMIVGRGTLGGRAVLVVAQEGRFMGGSIGEVHGAKLVGLLRAARQTNTNVLILFDSGGVRLQEANAGEVAIAEAMRALFEARSAGIAVVGLIGGRAGCFGGSSLIAGCCSTLVVSEEGRISVTGPEVIETNRGVEEFDSRDRALVWRTMGGKHRYVLGGADMFVEDDHAAFRSAALTAMVRVVPLDLTTLEAEQRRLERRLDRCDGGSDAVDLWLALGVDNPAALPDLPTGEFLTRVNSWREAADGAR